MPYAAVESSYAWCVMIAVCRTGYHYMLCLADVGAPGTLFVYTLHC